MTTQVWDMDGVLNTGNCFYAYVEHRFRRQPSALIRALPSLARHTMARSYEAKAECGHGLVRAITHGFSFEQYVQEVQTFGTSLAERPGFVRDEAVRRLREQAARGDGIVIATACEEHLAAAFLKAIQVPYDVLSATVFAVRDGRVVVQHARDSHRKTSALVERGVDLASAHFYTDDFADYPTAARSAHTTVVNPRQADVRAYAERGIAVDVVWW